MKNSHHLHQSLKQEILEEKCILLLKVLLEYSNLKFQIPNHIRENIILFKKLQIDDIFNISL